MKFGDQDKSWAPHKVCKHSIETLRFWDQGKVSSMRFGVSVVWREPKNHHDDCYFCMVFIDMSGWNQRKKDGYYPDVESARRPTHYIALKLQLQFSLLYLTLLQMKCYWKRWMILIAATVVLVALPAWLLQHLRSEQNQSHLVKVN